MKVGLLLTKAHHGIDALDVELLLTKILGITRASLKAYPERELSQGEYLQFEELLARRIKGEPVAYLIGHKEFWSLDFLVTQHVLVPRPDTELLVELALEQIAGKQNIRLLDLGTGSGAVALSIAAERPDITVIATDVSPDALNVAQINADQLQISNVEFILGDWFAALENSYNNHFNIIVSNPPYIAQFDAHLAQGGLSFEPNAALVSGEEGMDALRQIIEHAPQYLMPGGQLLVEHGYDQEQLVAKEFAQAGFTAVGCFKDLSGNPRVTMGTHGLMSRT